MGAKQHGARSPVRGLHGGAQRAPGIAVVVLLVIALALVGVLYVKANAYASIYTEAEYEQVLADDAALQGQQGSDQTAAPGEELIDDEDTPLASGEDLAQAQAPGIHGGFYAFIIVGIVAVVVVFAFLARRQNRSIKAMQRRIE